MGMKTPLTCYDDNNRHYFDWKSGSSYCGNDEIVKILNDNKEPFLSFISP